MNTLNTRYPHPVVAPAEEWLAHQPVPSTFIRTFDHAHTTNNIYTPYDALRWRLTSRREAYLARQRRIRQRRTLVVAIITTAALLAGFLFYGVTP